MSEIVENIELLPCPFCGGRGVVCVDSTSTIKPWRKEVKPRYFAKCASLMVSLGPEDNEVRCPAANIEEDGEMGGVYNTWPTPEDAAVAWNNRPGYVRIAEFCDRFGNTAEAVDALIWIIRRKEVTVVAPLNQVDINEALDLTEGAVEELKRYIHEIRLK